MADLDGALRSLRDTLHSLLARVGEDFNIADRVTRAHLKVNAILMNSPNEAPDAKLSKLRNLTEALARLGLSDKPKLNAQLGALETLLADLSG
jgi:hypothetical protein